MVTEHIQQFLDAASAWDSLKEKMSAQRESDTELNDYYRKWYSFATAFNNAQALEENKRSDRYGMIYLRLVKSLHDVSVLPERLKNQLLPVLEQTVQHWNNAFPEHKVD